MARKDEHREKGGVEVIVEFTIPSEPQGKGRARIFNRGGRSIAMTPEKTVFYENLIKTCYADQSGYYFGDSPLCMEITAYYSIPKSASKKKAELMKGGIIRPTKKPDVDNLAKCVADSINNIAYKDDSQIVEMVINKYYCEIPRVVVELSDEI